LLGQFSAMAYGVIDTVMTGHASPTDLAAMGLGAAVYGTVFVGLMGVMGALNSRDTASAARIARIASGF
jgi:multidrug resistance protein, MATE family